MLNREPFIGNREEKGGTQGNVNEEERRKGTERGGGLIQGRRSGGWRMKRRGKETR